MNLTLSIENLFKAYRGTEVLNGFSAIFSAPGIYCLMAPSGAGKTTLFRLIMGLEKPDGGAAVFTDGDGKNIGKTVTFSAVFQENRLIDHLSPIENVALVLPGKTGRADARRELLRLLPEESLTRPVFTLSGGMKRRCAFLRALIVPSDVVIMDEPFTGLDENTKDSVIRCLLERQNGRLFLISTHDPKDVEKLGASAVSLTAASS